MSRTLHLFNGNVIVDASTGQYSTSLTIEEGFICKHGAEAALGAECIDLNGQCVVPGLVDSHLHLVLGATGRGDISCSKCASKKDFQRLFLDALYSRDVGSWLVGFGWSDQALCGSPNRAWFPHEVQVPALCFRSDFHSAVVNDAFLERLETSRIRKMQGGNRVDDGIICEDALFQGVMPHLPALDSDVKVDRVMSSIKELHEKGITLVGTMEEKKEIGQVLVPIQKSQAIRMRVMCHDEPTPQLIEACNVLTQDDFLQVIGFKTFLDGTLGSRTAKMYTGWNDAEGSGVWTGHAANGSLREWVKTVSCAGYSPVLHAIGDEAVGAALDVLKDVDSSLTPRIEHAQCIAEKDLPALAGKWFGVQPSHQPSDLNIGLEALGRERMSQLHNWRRMLDAGGLLSFGSDWPISPPDPLLAMQIAIMQGLTAQEALVATTSSAAKSLQTDQAGHLGIGAFADIAVLDQDPLKCDWKESTPSVTMTIVSGRVVYKKE